MGKQYVGNRNTSRNAKFRSNNVTQTKPKKGIKKKVIVRSPDARSKIIQNKRTTVVDARDVLAKMAKTQDARSKLNKIRTKQHIRPSTSGNVKVIGNNIVQKVDRNGRISLTTNKSNKTTIKPKPDLNVAIKRQLGLIKPTRTSPKKQPPKRLAQNPRRPQNQRAQPVNIKKTILNPVDIAPLNARIERMERLYDASLYKWTNPEVIRPASHMIHTLEPMRRNLARENMLADRWSEYVPAHRPVAPPAYMAMMDEDEEMPLTTTKRQPIFPPYPRVSTVHSRLDGHSRQDSHGILSQAKTKVVLPAGHRIVVSNLQNTVTQDDIKELFEDIGDLLAARLIRDGVAEVIYKNLRDAQKAVDTYHNRQLDGQPMKCLLVNNRPLNHPTAPAIKSTQSDSLSIPARKPRSLLSTQLTPDVGTIHKALFQKK